MHYIVNGHRLYSRWLHAKDYADDICERRQLLWAFDQDELRDNRPPRRSHTRKYFALIAVHHHTQGRISDHTCTSLYTLDFLSDGAT